MNLQKAIDFIKPAINPNKKVWADIGAGTGLFTQALDQILLKNSEIYAVDKNPHVLYNLILSQSKLHVYEGDFTKRLSLPYLDGIIMANALHCVKGQFVVLKQLVDLLKPDGIFVLIEYETNQPVAPWVPYPVPFQKFINLMEDLPVTIPKQLTRISSAFNYQHIYLAKSLKIEN